VSAGGNIARAERKEARRRKAWPRWLRRQSERTDLFHLMRKIEKSLGAPLAKHKTDEESKRGRRPRLGDSASRSDEVIRLRWADTFIDAPLSFGQDPWMMFPASNIVDVDSRGEAATGLSLLDDPDVPQRIHVITRFLGLLGAQGPLPLHTTEEARGWLYDNDKAFSRFLDIFNNRFIQLFFRAWGDSRPIVHNDRPDQDRFHAYVNSMIGVGSQAFQGLEAVPAGIGAFAGVLGPKAKCASRLRQVIHGLFGVDAQIDEFVGSWLELEKSDRSSLGAQNSGLGSDFLIGAASFSVHDKIRIRLFVSSLDQYARFLPDGPDCDRLFDLMFFYIGDELDWDVELALPVRCAAPVMLGAGARLGWTSWVSPQVGPDTAPDAYRCDARFHPANRKRHDRDKARAQGGDTI
jgi:type VI secretion system protein ImpH